MDSTESKYSWLWKQFRELVVLVLILFGVRTFVFGAYVVPSGSMETTMLVGERFVADKFTILFSPPKRGQIISFNDPNYAYSDNRFVRLFEQYVWGPANITKRVIGLPGDTVKGTIEDGRPVIYVNGKKLDEPYLNKYPLVPTSYEMWRSYDPSKPFDQQPFYGMDPFAVKRMQNKYEMYGRRTVQYPGTPLEDGKGRDEFEKKLGDTEYWVMGDNRLGSCDSRYWGPLDGSLIHGKIIWRIFSIDTDQSWLILDLVFHPIDFFKKVRWSRSFQWIS